MTPTDYDALTLDERYEVLHVVYDEAIDALVADDFELPTPGQVAHQSFDDLHRCLRLALARA